MRFSLDVLLHDGTLSVGARAALRTRLEAAALNVTARYAQALYDGWLARFAHWSAKWVRSVNVLGLSIRTLDERLAYCSTLYPRHGLSMALRLTCIGSDFTLDAELAPRDYFPFDETRVMSMPLVSRETIRSELLFEIVNAARFAAAVGRMCDSRSEQIAEHQARLEDLAVDISPVLVPNSAGYCVAACAFFVWTLRFQRLLCLLVPPARRAG